jgi:hypothetical protein
MADNLPPSSTDVTESGSLNLPESSGPHRPVMGMLYFYFNPVTVVNPNSQASFKNEHAFYSFQNFETKKIRSR